MDRLLICTGRLVPKLEMTWQGLTDQEVAVIGCEIYGAHHWDDMRFYREVEKLLKERNEKNCTGHRDEHGSRYDPFVRNSGH